MKKLDDQETTHFGYEKVLVTEKQERVARVFRSVASRYDLMNDVMSLGTHRLIKRFTIQLSALRPGQRVLDLAGGTGDLSRQFSSLVGSSGRVVLADINEVMLKVGRDRMIDSGVDTNVDIAQLDAEKLPFADNTFDCICIAYGLRNITNKKAALEAMRKALKPGGRIVVLEFSKPENFFVDKAYGIFSSLWPLAGRLLTGDSDSYRYLVESIKMHPDQKTLLDMLVETGLENCRYQNVINGICAIHLGFKAQ